MSIAHCVSPARRKPASRVLVGRCGMGGEPRPSQCVGGRKGPSLLAAQEPAGACLWKHAMILCSPGASEMRPRPFAIADRCSASLAADMVIAAFDFVSLRRFIGCSRVNLISAARGMIWPAGCAGTGAMANRYLQRRSVFSVSLVAECDPAGSFLFELVVERR